MLLIHFVNYQKLRFLHMIFIIPLRFYVKVLNYDTYLFRIRIGIKLLRALLYFFIPDLGMYSLTCLTVLSSTFSSRECCCLSSSKALGLRKITVSFLI